MTEPPPITRCHGNSDLEIEIIARKDLMGMSREKITIYTQAKKLLLDSCFSDIKTPICLFAKETYIYLNYVTTEGSIFPAEALQI